MPSDLLSSLTSPWKISTLWEEGGGGREREGWEGKGAGGRGREGGEGGGRRGRRKEGEGEGGRGREGGGGGKEGGASGLACRRRG